MLITLCSLAPAGLRRVTELLAEAATKLGPICGRSWLALGVSLNVIHSFLQVGGLEVYDKVINGCCMGDGGEVLIDNVLRMSIQA